MAGLRGPNAVAGLLDAAARGDTRALGRLISHLEQDGPEAYDVARAAFSRAGQAWVVGITGAPGAGKSSLIARLVAAMRNDGDTVAVVAVDPSSPFSGGAILGDRVRMQSHATDPGVYIRSMASRGELGGLAQASLGAIRVLDAAGWPSILVETVGAGQVEVDVAQAVDTTVVVVTPGWGDGVQAVKAGLLEIADVFVVNKADRPGADEAARDLELLLDIGPEPAGGWRPPVVRTVASAGEGIDGLRDAIARRRAHLAQGGRLEQRRGQRLEHEVRRLVAEAGSRSALAHCQGPEFDALVQDVMARHIDPGAAAERLLS